MSSSNFRIAQLYPAKGFGSGPLGFYNREASVVALVGPRGVLLAHYPHPHPPHPSTAMLVQFPENYTPLRSTVIPTIVPADVVAVAWPASTTPKSQGPAIAGAGDYGDTPSNAESESRLEGGPGEGIRTGPGYVEMQGGGTSIRLSGSGLFTNGVMEARGQIARGVTTESPLFGLVPKSAVTIFADYLPAVQATLQAGAFVLQARRALSMTGRLGTILKKFGDLT